MVITMKVLDAANQKKLKRIKDAHECQSHSNKTDPAIIEQIESLLHNATRHQTSMTDKELAQAHDKLHRKCAPPIAP